MEGSSGPASCLAAVAGAVMKKQGNRECSSRQAGRSPQKNRAAHCHLLLTNDREKARPPRLSAASAKRLWVNAVVIDLRVERQQQQHTSVSINWTAGATRCCVVEWHRWSQWTQHGFRDANWLPTQKMTPHATHSPVAEAPGHKDVSNEGEELHGRRGKRGAITFS